MSSRATNLFCTLILLIICASCSSGGGLVAPDESNDIVLKGYDSLPVLVSDYDSDGNPAGGWGILGLFQLVGNPEIENIELIPLRNSTLTDTLEVVDITNFLTLAPCTDCAKIENVEMTSANDVQLNISIRHPFKAGDPLKPISGQNRADLHVFNIEGLILADSTTETPVSFTGIGNVAGNFQLKNADGFSPYLDTAIDNIFPNLATVHPYKLHFNDYTDGNFNAANSNGFADVLAPTGNLVMAMGSDSDMQPYIFDLTGITTLNFIFAIGCTYAVSSESKSMRFSPEYRIPQHNKKAASEVHVEINTNNLRGLDPVSDCILDIKILDMSHGVPAGTNFDEMLSISDVASITVEVPGVTASPVTVSSPTPVTGTPRDPADPMTFQITFTNSASADTGTYSGLVKVLDTYAPGQNTAPILNGMDGIERVDPIENPLIGLFNIPEFATYAVFSVDVEIGTEIPVCDIQSTPNGPDVFTDQNIDLDGSASFDPDGTITTYEWDFDYNYISFDVDETGATVQTSYPSEGTFTVGLRVTDNMTASSICTKDFNVTTSTLPDDFIQIDDTNTMRNLTILEDNNQRLHAFYGDPAAREPFDNQSSTLYHAYSTDYGNTWLGHTAIYATSGSGFHVLLGGYDYPVVSSHLTNETGDETIYLAWMERDWHHPSDIYQRTERIMAASVDISDPANPVTTTTVVLTGRTGTGSGYRPWSYGGAHITSTSTGQLMMYYMEYHNSPGSFWPKYKFAQNFADLNENQAPSQPLESTKIINGDLIWIYNSLTPLFAVDSNDNILFTMSGYMTVSGNTQQAHPPSLPYSPGRGSAILRYNQSADNWSFVQHYGADFWYWDNHTQSIRIDDNDNIHWVFEWETNNSGYYGDFTMVYGTGPSTGQWNFTYTDPIHPNMTDSGHRFDAEFICASIDVNSQGEIWITYQDAYNVPEIYYTFYNGTSWQTPTALTVPPQDDGNYPFMFISSWDGMYVVFSDDQIDGYPWLKVIDTL